MYLLQIVLEFNISDLIFPYFRQVTLVVDRGMSWEAAMERLETFNKNDIEDSKENLQPSLEINKIENDESSTDNSAATMKSEPNWR